MVNGEAPRISDHQAKLYAHLLMQQHANDDVEKLTGILYDAQVEPKPHQIDAALFALNTPFLRGVILADEVGLGKTIEAGIVISQYWALRKRNVLVVVPASLRQQWLQELQEKFLLPSVILDSESSPRWIKQGPKADADRRVLICSYEFARDNHKDLLRPWDLVVSDEAHRLRNLWRGKAKTAQAIAKIAGASEKNILMTATPLQNRLEELYGLVSAFDPDYFGSLGAFRARYIADEQDANLRERMSVLAKRTLRKDADKYIHFTDRLPLTFEFMPSEAEQELYQRVDDYLHRDYLFAFDSSQRALAEMVVRKRLGSSTRAVAATLERITNRLDGSGAWEAGTAPNEYLGDEFASKQFKQTSAREPRMAVGSGHLQGAIREEVAELRALAALARSVPVDVKAVRLIDALEAGFERLREIGAPQKAIVFTESRETQMFLTQVLRGAGYGDGLVLFNGSNDLPEQRAIYREWLVRNAGSDAVTGVFAADMRKALVDHFRDSGQILIATEAAAEGINLQFCSMLVNYDLPWNPQRVEQRIGRVHRYGQKHNVVVANFLNEGNVAERRVLQLLQDKFKLFSEVFGSSDEVLGSIEDGFDFEKAVGEILSHCRTEQELEDAFAELEAKHASEISVGMERTRQRIFEDLDPRVQDLLLSYDERTDAALTRFERLLLAVTRHELADHAHFEGDGHTFLLHSIPPVLHEESGIETGHYYFKSHEIEGARRYRSSSSLGQWVLTAAANRSAPPSTLEFSLSESDRAGQAISRLLGRGGWLGAALVRISTAQEGALEETRVIVSAFMDDGTQLDDEYVEDLLALACTSTSTLEKIGTWGHIEDDLRARQDKFRGEFENRVVSHFDRQHEILDQQRLDLEADAAEKTKTLRRQSDDAYRKADSATDARERHRLRKKGSQLLNAAADLEDDMRVELRKLLRDMTKTLDEAEVAFQSTVLSEELFRVRWRIVE